MIKNNTLVSVCGECAKVRLLRIIVILTNLQDDLQDVIL